MVDPGANTGAKINAGTYLNGVPAPGLCVGGICPPQCVVCVGGFVTTVRLGPNACLSRMAPATILGHRWTLPLGAAPHVSGVHSVAGGLAGASTAWAKRPYMGRYDNRSLAPDRGRRAVLVPDSPRRVPSLLPANPLQINTGMLLTICLFIKLFYDVIRAT
jgi:hypothetical protein